MSEKRQNPPIENYAIIGDCETAALVGLNGSIDWLCWPHFASDACFAHLACSFWMVSNLKQMGREDEAKRLFERVLALANDVGLLSEEYDIAHKRLVGNFPQAFSHIALANAAFDLAPDNKSSSRQVRNKTNSVDEAVNANL